MTVTFKNTDLLNKTSLPSQSDELDLTVCLVNWNTREMLRECIQSITKFSGSLKIEIFVIDNASHDGSSEMIRDHFPNVQLISNTTNIGFAKANNQGIKQSNGRNIMLMNPDTLIHSNALDKMVNFLDQNPEAGIVAAKLLNRDLTLQYSLRRFPNLLTPFTENPTLANVFFMKPFTALSRLEDWDHSQICEVEQPAGAAIMIKRAVIDTLGKLDGWYHMFFEDVDLCFRIKKNGWKIYYLPEAEIIHYGGQSVKQHHNIGEEFYRSLIGYFQWHYGKWGGRKTRLMMIIGSFIYMIYSVVFFPVHPGKSYKIIKTTYMLIRCSFRKMSNDN